MNFWTGLILGIIIGWLVEWIIDWLFWRRDAADAREGELLMEERLAAADANEAALQMEWEGRLSTAEEEYQARLRAVEEEWQSRLNLNEQQWQSQFTTLESDNRDLRARMSDMMAGATLAAAGVALADGVTADDTSPPEAKDSILTDEMIVAELAEESSPVDMPSSDEVWPADRLSADTGGLWDLDQMDSDIAERLHLAGIDSVDALADADPNALSVTTGLERSEVDVLIERAAATLPRAGAATLAAAGLATTIRRETPGPRDDLTRIHGIGPKYADLLTTAGITSFDELAAATPDQLRDIIKPSAYQQINFESWSAQALALAGARSATAGDDLTELEGIGPVYATKLRERGIVTFAGLAATDEATLAEIIGAPAWRRVNYGDWIAQARFAAAGDESGLHELQNRLFSRTGDNLSLIHGMGSRSASALQAAGITTFAALASATPDQIDGIVRGASVRGGFDYDAWIHEAGLRAAGKRVATGRSRPSHTVPCPQDLSAVAGIGPVFEERLYAAGIGSYWELAETPVDELSTILDARAFQGVDLNAIKASAMQLAVESNSLGRAWDGTPPDDFDVLAGIGEVYERRLYEAGICTYEALAAVSPERLAEICKAPPMRTPDYAAWVATATELSAAKRSG